jgi:capsular polysaccharide transport system ATP-binding protein
MIFSSVTKSYKTLEGRKVILDDCSFHLKEGLSLAVLGGNGAGKSTLLRLISGAESADSGRIQRGSRRVSWPLGLASGFQTSLTGRDNIRFVARLYGRNPQTVIDEVEAFAEIGDYLTMPVKTYSSGMKARVAFGLSLAIDFDLYLIDEIIAVGDAAFKAKSLKAFKAKTKIADVIMVSHSTKTLKDFCDYAVTLHEGRMTFNNNLHEAITLYERETHT